MKAKAVALSVTSMFALLAPFTVNTHPAQALFGSDACKKVNFRVTNNVRIDGQQASITVKRIDLYSKDEGRWLKENFANKTVLAGKTNTVRKNENVEYGESDEMTKIKVHFKAYYGGKWRNHTATHSLTRARCYAGKTYIATVNSHLATPQGNTCKNVKIRVNNNVTSNGRQIRVTVQKVQLWSVQEGRWLTEDFTNKKVPAGRQNYTVAAGQNIQKAGGDQITRIRVHFKARPHTKWINFATTDTSIPNQTCVDGHTYVATMSTGL